MPSPTSTTVPTLRVSAPASNESMADLMMLVISSERMAMGADLLEGARDELIPQPLEATPDAPVDQAVADPDDEATEQARIDLDVQFDAAAGGLLQPLGEGPDLVRGQRGGARGGCVGDAQATIVEPT